MVLTTAPNYIKHLSEQLQAMLQISGERTKISDKAERSAER